MTDRRRTHDKQVTVPDAVKGGVRSDIAKITVTGSQYTGAIRSKFTLREEKHSVLQRIQSSLKGSKEPFPEICYVQEDFQLRI
jgi:hypothetical protein